MTAPVAKVVHRTSTRTRLRTRGMKGDLDYFAQIQTALRAMEGVRSVHVNPLTESILIEHDKPIDPLLQEAEARGYLQMETEETRRPPYLERLGHALRESDKNLEQATTGKLNLDTLAFFGLLAGGVYQVANGHGLPAGVTLLRYAIELMTGAAETSLAKSAPDLQS